MDGVHRRLYPEEPNLMKNIEIDIEMLIWFTVEFNIRMKKYIE